ncbi:MAG TPA: tetratricopeptide repeat protein [Candidatus Saccharimonadales bacterium]|nr:tetratricopeptide repeat protein [Candidatus Saccharimonadales bacterium]
MRKQTLLAVVLFCSAQICPSQAADKQENPKFPPRLKAFFAEKEHHARSLAKSLNLQLSPELWEYFQAGTNGDWPAVGALFEDLKQRNRDNPASPDVDAIETPAWFPVTETFGAYEEFEGGSRKYCVALAQDIIKSMPHGSIYFGGNGPALSLVAAFGTSHEKGDPVFTLNQSTLANGKYLTYLRATYGPQIAIPTDQESGDAFAAYSADARRRLEHDQRAPNEPKQVRPGEDIKIIGGKVQMSGHVSVMAINALLAKLVFDRNTNRQFYVVESFPLDWMYPYLSPNGLIMKLNRSPLPELTPQEVSADQECWTKYLSPLLGPWLRETGSVKEACEYARKVHARHDLARFKEDPELVNNERTSQTFSKLRSALGGLFYWRLMNAKSPAEKQRMQDAADYAFRQAFALSPASPEAVFRYINLLMTVGRVDDAILLAQTAADVDPSNGQLKNLLGELDRIKQRQK